MTSHPHVSLCEQCQHLREVISGKGSRFLRCDLATSNPAYRKYPPQPVMSCVGYEENKQDAK